MNGFPDPIEHAAVILDACLDNLIEARNLARINYLTSAAPDKAYWFDVLKALTPNRESN